jgi:beta-lactamase class D
MSGARSFLLIASIVVLLASGITAGCGGGAMAETVESADTLRVSEAAELSRFFGDIEGTFVLLDPQTDELVVYNPHRASTRFLPASTFKIPNTLIALETGVADGPGFALTRDPDVAPEADWWPRSWLEEHTLATALPASVVWFYQELARRIGPDRMQDMLDRFDYGNADISGGIDRFWLSGGLRISAREQVDFLRQFYYDELGASTAATAIVKDLLVMEEAPSYRLSGKTGWAGLGADGEPDVGWLVGYLERGADVVFYATNIEIRTNADAAERLRITRDILTELGLLGEADR